MKKSIILLILLLTTAVQADELFPAAGWVNRHDPVASRDAEIGGELSIFAGQYSKSLNYFLDNNVLSSEIFGAMFETMLSMNPLTLEYEPALAEKWTISDDKKTFTFMIDKKARWSDGKPITAKDVKWTYATIMNPKNLTGPHKVGLERFNPPRVIDKYTIEFTAKDVHWRNLGTVGGLTILCKHAYENMDFNKLNFEFPVVSGPYGLGKINEGVSVKLERRDDYWGRNAKSAQGKGNFQTFTFKFFA